MQRIILRKGAQPEIVIKAMIPISGPNRDRNRDPEKVDGWSWPGAQTGVKGSSLTQSQYPPMIKTTNEGAASLNHD